MKPPKKRGRKKILKGKKTRKVFSLTASQTDAEWPELNPISQIVLTAGMRASATCILRRRKAVPVWPSVTSYAEEVFCFCFFWPRGLE